MGKQSTGRGFARTISRIETDGTLIETIYRPNTIDTVLVVHKNSETKIVGQWEVSGVTYTPVSATNNLLKHGALVLPSDTTEYIDTDHLLDDVAVYISKYVYLPDDALRLAAAYALLSWVYDAFNELPYVRFRGDYGTGKTRALLVIGAVCYKAFFASGASTISPIFHTLDTFKGTLVFDEADFRFTDEKAELVKILNNGNVKGFPVLRSQVTPKKEFDPRAFTIFGPKIVATRGAYQDRALESRFLTIEMESGWSDGMPLNLPEAQKKEALELRNKLLTYRLRNRLLVALDPDLADPHLEPRLNQILLPLLSVVSRETWRAAIRGTATALQTRIKFERAESSDGRALAILVRLMAEQAESSISLSEIASAFGTEYATEFARPITNRWIGSILRRLGIALYKSNGIVVTVPGQQERINALCARYGVARPTPRPISDTA